MSLGQCATCIVREQYIFTQLRMQKYANNFFFFCTDRHTQILIEGWWVVHGKEMRERLAAGVDWLLSRTAN
jgi:hypothetical protein